MGVIQRLRMFVAEEPVVLLLVSSVALVILEEVEKG
ncbi:hypothetical protein BVRB_2g041970 [Beta vulgaris subsp. vulgaris]|nr:hypothetical protein BVRB_2g041970 [Beta vulgaris subsp. vulgaris]